MKILAISTWFPFPPDNGSRTRIYHLLKYIAEKHTVDLLAITQHDRDMDYMHEVEKICRRVSVFPSHEFDPSNHSSISELLSRIPRGFRARHSPEMESEALKWSGEDNYDAAVAMSLGAAPYVAKLNIPFKVLDQHNVESQVIKRQWQNEKSTIRRIRFAPTWIKAAQFERDIARKFDAISVVSEPDRIQMGELLQNGSRKKIKVIPNGVDPELFEYRGTTRDTNTLVFSGALTYGPNYDAALLLCREILPAIQAQRPEARLRVTGRCDNVDISQFAGTRGLDLTGYVDDIRPAIASASALVVPIRYGGGTRLKILEAMALGTPVVSTPLGAEGLDAQDGVNILIGETPSQIAEQALRVMSDTQLASDITASAREFVRQYYKWPAIADEFEKMLLQNIYQEKTGKCMHSGMK